MSRALARITAEHAGKTVVVVCHGGVIGTATLYFAGLDTAAACFALMYPLPEHRPLLGRPWLLGFRAVEFTSITHSHLAAAGPQNARVGARALQRRPPPARPGLGGAPQLGRAAPNAPP